MSSLSLLSDTELLARVAASVETERAASADVVKHLMEVERRRLYLDQACSSLYTYCRERLGYSEDAALRRARVARLALRLPRVLDELSSGAIHLTGLFLLDRYLSEENADELLADARGKSRRELEKIVAIRFPRPDVPSTIEALGMATLLLDARASGVPVIGETGGSHPEAASGPSSWFTCPGPGTAGGRAAASDFRSRVEPLSAERYRVEFTASSALRAKIDQARELMSHALPNGDLSALFERALDELIERELKRRVGAERPRSHMKPRSESRHVPRAVVRQVRERDGDQCAFVDSAGRRCTERRWLTLEHRHPFSLGGPPTVENLCLFCKAHNEHSARRVFGEAFIASKRAAGEDPARNDDVATNKNPGLQSAIHSDAFAKARSALTRMGFCHRAVAGTISRLHREHPALEVEPLLRAALRLLTPPPS
jgi:hypothetical protein